MGAALAVQMVLAVVFLFAAPQAGAQSPSRQPAAHDSGLPPRITTQLRNVAQFFTKLKLRERYKTASESTIGKLTKKVMKKWVKEKAKECPDPLPRTYFCERPVQPRWGIGTSLEVGGRWAGEFRSPWLVATAPRTLRPGYNWWLTCWSEGRRVRNAGGNSNLWYRLTNRLWVNSLFLYTGTNFPIEGVSHC